MSSTSTSNLIKYADTGDPIRIAAAQNGGEAGQTRFWFPVMRVSPYGANL